MKKFLLVLFALVLVLMVSRYSIHTYLKSNRPKRDTVVRAATDSSNTTLVQTFSPTNVAKSKLIDTLADEPPDVLIATNLEQWKALVKDLKQVKGLPDHWTTARQRARNSPVLLKYNGQSIIYKVRAVEVTTLYNNTTELLQTRLYGPRMNIDETRELGLKLCTMFGYDSNKFLAWCNNAGNNWLDAPLFNTGDSKTSTGDQNHFLSVRSAYNDKQPWYIVFSIEQKSAYLKLH